MNGLPRWNAFLQSLATRGGAIFILVLLTVIVWLGTGMMYLRHDLTAEQLKDTVGGSGAITGALLLALKASSDTQTTVTSTPNGTSKVSISDGATTTAATSTQEPNSAK